MPRQLTDDDFVMARKVAARYARSAEQFDNALSIAYLALVKASHDYDEEKIQASTAGVASHFGAYAVQRMTWRITDDFLREKKQVPTMSLSTVVANNKKIVTLGHWIGVAHDGFNRVDLADICDRAVLELDLSDHERNVLDLVCQGLSHDEIANRLGENKIFVKTRMTAIRRRASRISDRLFGDCQKAQQDP